MSESFVTIKLSKNQIMIAYDLLSGYRYRCYEELRKYILDGRSMEVLDELEDILLDTDKMLEQLRGVRDGMCGDEK